MTPEHQGHSNIVADPSGRHALPGPRGRSHVVLDFTRRTKGAQRERIGLAGELVAAMTPHFDEVTVLYPRDEAPPPRCEAAGVVGVELRSDLLCEEVLLPRLLKRLRATHVFTFREAFVLPTGIGGHLHLHEDPVERRSFEGHARNRTEVKAAIAEWRHSRRFASLLRRIRSLTDIVRLDALAAEGGTGGRL